jgi:ribose 5-phosphate isomerase A
VPNQSLREEAAMSSSGSSPTDPAAAAKRASARLAAGLVESGMRVGLGTGSTAALFLEELAARLRSGDLGDIAGVPTSRRTAHRAAELGIPLTTLDSDPSLDLVVDGADEVDPSLDLIKGLGGALLWEKIVAQAGRRMVVVADQAKLVDRLGTKAPLPVEVVPFGVEAQAAYLRDLGAEPALRRGDDGEPYVTDAGHHIIDARFPDGITDPRSLDDALASRAGIVDSGLFLGLADTAIVGRADGSARVLHRPEAT